MVVSFMPGESGDPDFLDAEVVLREGLPASRISQPFIDNGSRGITHRAARLGAAPVHPGRHRPGARRRDRGGDLGASSTSRRTCAAERLGEFTVGIDLHRSESLALVQLLILYHLVMARAAIALGGERHT